MNMTPPEARNKILEIMTKWFDARSRGDTVADVAQDLANLDGEIEIVIHELVVSERERCALICDETALNWSPHNDEYQSIALMCGQNVRAGKVL